MEELENQGVLLSELREAAGDPAIDDFDLICHVAFDKPPLTRAERVRNVRKGDYLHKYSDQARAVIEALLDKYKDSGITQLEDLRVLQVEPFSAMDSPMNLARRFGGRNWWAVGSRSAPCTSCAAGSTPWPDAALPRSVRCPGPLTVPRFQGAPHVPFHLRQKSAKHHAQR